MRRGGGPPSRIAGTLTLFHPTCNYVVHMGGAKPESVLSVSRYGEPEVNEA